MKFEQITNAAFGAMHAGYKIDLAAERQIDAAALQHVKYDHGENYVYSEIDALYDFDGDLYRGDDGEYYTVWMHDNTPIIWHKLTPILYTVKPEHIDSWFTYDEPTPVTRAEIERLAAEWNIPIDELMQQVEEA